MIIKSETVVVTTVVECEGDFFKRVEDPLGIYWIADKTLLFECREGRWLERFHCRMRDCDRPELENLYQDLKNSPHE